MWFATPGAGQGAFNLLRLARGGAKTPQRRGAMPSPPLMLPSPGSPSPGAKLGAALLLEFAQQSDNHTLMSCKAITGPTRHRPLLLEGHLSDSASPITPTDHIPAHHKGAEATASHRMPLRAAMAALKAPLRSALKRKQLTDAHTPAAPLPSEHSAKSTRRVRFLQTRRSPASGGTDERRGGTTSPWCPTPSVLMTPGGRRYNGGDSCSPIRGGSASSSTRVATARGCCCLVPFCCVLLPSVTYQERQDVSST